MKQQEERRARVLAVATAVPPHRASQAEARDVAAGLFSSREIRRYVSVFDHAGVSYRHLCRPLPFYAEDHPFGEKNRIYQECALELSEKAARRALDKAGVGPEEVGAVFFVSTTGLSTPSLDNDLMLNLGLPRENVDQFALFGHGCAAGAGTLGKAARWAEAEPGRVVLVVVAEMCSLTFDWRDASRANVVSSSLFADGAAAVVLRAADRRETQGPQIVGRDSVLWPETRHVMGWRFTEAGFGVILSKEVPEIVRTRFRESLVRACGRVGVSMGDIRHFVAHPGGAKVLDAMEEVLGLEQGTLTYSRQVLAEYGNMSAVTVLTILQKFLEAGEYAPGDLGLISAMGPGFRAEHVFFRC